MQARLVALLLSAALGLCATQAHAESFVIGDIEIEGLQRISAGTLFTYLPLQVGEDFETRRSGEVARALYRTGFFDDITLRRRGDILVIEVRERPSIADIRFDGNEDIETEQLEEVLKQVGIARGRVFNRSVLERLERELRQQYFARGKYNVKIETTIEELPRNRVDVSIDISEGQIARIREVTIVGNEDVDEDDLLDEMESGTVSAWKFWSSRDEYSKQKLAGDLEKIRSVYLDDGYVRSSRARM
jgi:outer membrane protein insertion porin family